MMVVGTRGDVNPFVQLALRLKRDGHRVRLATHEIFRNDVESFQLEFFPLKGDPHELSKFMVKTHGSVIPSVSDLKDEVPKNLEMLKEIIYSCWDACIGKDPYAKNPKDSRFLSFALIVYIVI